MPFQSSLLPGLVVGVLAGGIAGAALAWLVDPGSGGPSVGAGIGAAVAAGIGYLVAWLVIARRSRPTSEASVADEPGPAVETDPRPAPVDAPSAAAIEPLPTAELPAARAGSGLLTPSCINLSGTATDRAGAIDEVGALLVATGAVEPGYVAAMHARDRAVSTHMGNLLAVPHGNHDARRLVRSPALALVRYPDTIEWHGNRVRFVVATAGLDDADQVRLVSRVAEVFLDETAVARLEAAQTPAEVAAAFAGDAV